MPTLDHLFFPDLVESRYLIHINEGTEKFGMNERIVF